MPADPVLADDLRHRDAGLAFLQNLDTCDSENRDFPMVPPRGVVRESLHSTVLQAGELYGSAWGSGRNAEAIT
jgi:hypothetical protein